MHETENPQEDTQEAASPEEEEKTVDWRVTVINNITDFAMLDEMQADFKANRPEDLREFKRLRNRVFNHRLRGQIVWHAGQGPYRTGNKKAKKQRAAVRKLERKAHRLERAS